MNQVGNASISLTQVRGKKTEGRLKSAGVVIRLLKDVRKYGKEGKQHHRSVPLLSVLKQALLTIPFSALRLHLPHPSWHDEE